MKPSKSRKCTSNDLLQILADNEAGDIGSCTTIAFSNITFLSDTPNFNQGATGAIITLEADPTSADLQKVARFKRCGASPTTTDGQPLGDLGQVQVNGAAALAAFRIISIDPAKTHTLQIEYIVPNPNW